VIAVRLAFIIPAHNEELMVGRTIAACAASGRSSGEPFEIIVACDACTDRTAELACAAGARVIEIDKRVIAAVRNAGAKAAIDGGVELLFFVDADTSPAPPTVREAIDHIRGGGIGGGAMFRFDGTIPLGVRWTCWVMTTIMRTMRLTGGCFLFCTRAGYQAAGGWDETLLVSEEITMARSLKQHGRFEIVRTPVITSGRKLRTYSTWEIVSLLARGILRPSMRRDRKQLDLWYAPRRADPQAPAALNQQIPRP
jgi:glycosyltransferase involved in cell wall biosynthesis